MKQVISLYLVVIGLLNASCIKDANLRPPQRRPDEQPIYLRQPNDGGGYLPPPTTCINSFDEFIKVFGNPVLSVDSVELENGEHLSGGIINKMTYQAVNKVTSASIFQSQFTVVYNSSGYLQEFFQNVWTLGCLYLNSAAPPFTNIIFKGKYYRINTCFTWGGPPQSQNHLIVRFIFIK